MLRQISFSVLKSFHREVNQPKPWYCSANNTQKQVESYKDKSFQAVSILPAFRTSSHMLQSTNNLMSEKLIMILGSINIWDICSLTGSAFYHLTKQTYSSRLLYYCSCWFATGAKEKKIAVSSNYILEHEKEAKNKIVGKKLAGRFKW